MSMFLAHLYRMKTPCTDHADVPGPALQERVPAQTMSMLLAHFYRIKILHTQVPMRHQRPDS